MHILTAYPQMQEATKHSCASHYVIASPSYMVHPKTRQNNFEKVKGILN